MSNDIQIVISAVEGNTAALKKVQGDLENIGKQAGSITQVFKRSWTELNSYIHIVMQVARTAKQAFDNVMASANMNTPAAKAFVKANKDMDEQMTELKNTIAQDLMPTLTELAQILTGVLTLVNDNAEAAKRWSDIISGVMTLGIGPLLKKFSGDVLDALTRSENQVDKTTNGYDRMFKSVQDNSKKASDAITATIDIQGLVDQAYASRTQTVLTFSATLMGAYENAKDAEKEFVDALAQGQLPTESLDEFNTRLGTLSSKADEAQQKLKDLINTWMLEIMMKQAMEDKVITPEEEAVLTGFMETVGLASGDVISLASDAYNTAMDAIMTTGQAAQDKLNGFQAQLDNLPKEHILTMVLQGKKEGDTAVVDWFISSFGIDVSKSGTKGTEEVTYKAGGGSFSGWAMVGDAPGGKMTPYTEWVYAPHGAMVYNQKQIGKQPQATPMASGGVIFPANEGIDYDKMAMIVRDAVLLVAK